MDKYPYPGPPPTYPVPLPIDEAREMPRLYLIAMANRIKRAALLVVASPDPTNTDALRVLLQQFERARGHAFNIGALPSPR